MALHIIVCVKSTPSSVNVGVDASGQPKIAGVATALNPFDEVAIEAAVRIKESVAGSTTTALTVGPDAAADVLREAIARVHAAGNRLAQDLGRGVGPDGVRRGR